MIDRQLIEECEYKDFAPIFLELENVLRKLESREIRSIVGDRPMDHLEDRFIRLVLETFRALEK